MQIDITKITNWITATKTKPIKVKLFKQVFNDDNVIKHFLLKTLEGNAEIDQYNYLCIGENGDVWQQSYDTLQKKYDYVDYDSNLWSTFKPKPDNEINCILVVGNGKNIIPNGKGNFYIIGKWGEDWNGLKNVQWGMDGDYICQNKTDSTDVWIVKRKIFENTYEIVEKEEDWEISSIYKNPDGN